MKTMLAAAAAAAAVSLALAGCQTDRPPAPEVSVSGPQLAVTDFDCGPQPAPPNRKAATGDKAGSAATAYKDDLKYHDQRCANRVVSICNRLAGAGQVIDANGNKVAACAGAAPANQRGN